MHIFGYYCNIKYNHFVANLRYQSLVIRLDCSTYISYITVSCANYFISFIKLCTTYAVNYIRNIAIYSYVTQWLLVNIYCYNQLLQDHMSTMGMYAAIAGTVVRPDISCEPPIFLLVVYSV